MSGIQVDISGAIEKTKVLKAMPKAVKYNLTDWATETTQWLKANARNMKKSGRKTGAMARSVGFRISMDGDKYRLEIGTGVGPVKDLPYARIQDVGGNIVPKKKKYLTVPFPGIRGVAANYPGAFCFKSKKGNLILAQKMGTQGRIKPLFLLTKKVTIPASRWFSSVWERREHLLAGHYLEEHQILRTAEKLSGGKLGTT